MRLNRLLLGPLAIAVLVLLFSSDASLPLKFIAPVLKKGSSFNYQRVSKGASWTRSSHIRSLGFPHSPPPILPKPTGSHAPYETVFSDRDGTTGGHQGGWSRPFTKESQDQQAQFDDPNWPLSFVPLSPPPCLGCLAAVVRFAVDAGPSPQQIYLQNGSDPPDPPAGCGDCFLSGFDPGPVETATNGDPAPQVQAVPEPPSIYSFLGGLLALFLSLTISSGRVMKRAKVGKRAG